jgi:hypothetical protein
MKGKRSTTTGRKSPCGFQAKWTVPSVIMTAAKREVQGRGTKILTGLSKSRLTGFQHGSSILHAAH